MARPMPLAFSDAEFARRLRDLRTRMRAKPVDVLLAVAAENITYLTGYETIGYSNFGVLAVRQEELRWRPVPLFRSLVELPVAWDT